MADARLKNAFPGPPPSHDDVIVFCAAGKTGDIDILKKMLAKFGPAIINERDTGGDTALSWAAWTGQKDAVVFLLDKGAGLESPGMHGKTALIWAAQGGKSDVVMLLLEKGANVHAKDEHGETALTITDRNGLNQIATQLRDWISGQAQLAILRQQEEEARALTADRLSKLKDKAPKIKIGPKPPGK